MTGLSMPQVTRLIRQHRQNGYVKSSRKARRRFPRKYTAADFALLAKVDEAHQRLNGPATKWILRREWEVFGKGEYFGTHQK
jgi:DNA-binding MarR family transcriptional regulator